MQNIALAFSFILLCLVLRFLIENSLPYYRDTATELLSRLCSRVTEVLGLLLTGERFYTVWVRVYEDMGGEEQTAAAEMQMKTGSVIACAALYSSGPEEMKRVMELAAAEAALMSEREYARLCGVYGIVVPRLLEKDGAGGGGTDGENEDGIKGGES